MNEPILYIEDEEDYQLLVRRILERAGLQVITADNGAEGLAMLRQQRPSVLILDINLPDTDGYAICSQLRQDPAWVDLPILMLTVRRRPEEWLRGFASGANDYISKPLNPPELVERVVACLNGTIQANRSEGSAEYQMLQAAQAGNKAAFQVFLEQYRDRLTEGMRVNGHSDAVAEDITSAAFVKAYENMAQFRGEASFYTWLYRIAMNTARDYYSKRDSISIEHLSKESDAGVASPLASAGDRVEDQLTQKEDGERARDALRLVSEPYRETLELFFLQDLTYDQIAQKLDIPMGTVMSRLHKGRVLLQEAWKKRAVFEPLSLD